MRSLRRILPFLLALLILTGCARKMPIKEAEVTQPAPEVIEPATELPTETAKKRTLSAEDIYWRSKFAAGQRAGQYTTSSGIDLRIGSAGVFFRTQMTFENRVTMSAEPCAVNVESELFYTLMNVEVEQTIREYYRDEDGKLICYFDIEQMDISGREELDLEGMTPYTIILQYTVYGYPYSLPHDLEVAPETQMLNDTEVYVLTYTQTAMDVFGVIEQTNPDPQLTEVSIPTTWYVDAETFLPVEISYSIDEVSDVVSAALVPYLDLQLSTGSEEEIDLQISSFSYRCHDMSFDPVEVPEVPEDVINKAKEAIGYTAV